MNYVRLTQLKKRKDELKAVLVNVKVEIKKLGDGYFENYNLKKPFYIQVQKIETELDLIDKVLRGEKTVRVKYYTDHELDGVKSWDYPDFSDAFISSATAVLMDGTVREATEDELADLNSDGLPQELAYERF